MERLTERDNNCGYGWDIRCRRCDILSRRRCLQCSERTRLYNRLADYEDAEEQGRLIELPIGIGDKIYEVMKDYNMVIDNTVYGYRVDGGPLYFYIGSGVYLNTLKMGKTVFRTREEAEAKLKEMEDEDNGDS